MYVHREHLVTTMMRNSERDSGVRHFSQTRRKENMDSETTLEASSEVTPESIKFSDLGLADDILQAVTESGYDTPTTIQARAIPALLSGKDIIGASQTGTGKTAAFALPILSKLERGKPFQVVVIEPTRELAYQVRDAFEKYAKHTGIKVSLLYGGVGYGKQREELNAGPEVVVATPGRLIDHVGQKSLSLSEVSFLVLDEADRMLDLGFIDAVRKIVAWCSKERQSLLFSATVPEAIDKLAKVMLRDPERIAVGGGRSAAETVNHRIYPVDDRQKFDLLVALLKKTDFKSVIIFCRMKRTVDIIARWLEQHGHPEVAVLHSDRNQTARESALASFRDGTCPLLVATDIVARGIDISGVSHVINYDIPQHCEDYVHRIGRTGRMRNIGEAMTLYTAVDTEFLRSIERFIGQTIPREQLENFDYNYTPVLSENEITKRKRNRGYSGASHAGGGRRRRR